ncbi:MAG: GxxExxY protein [Bacteroidetes bacterium GWC2_33_15]|nr:MAG: GxxExxY protein [Bacteroidetes bacterium GWA2_33_15]OFX50737.1 MAG: GxxExxY protein [Bacteroidetes bacterium GWC2_33_15]OFX62980.1 MAG: GxxExxY protein [Bacteroidetes bacterium GWB2_32_14]OFX70049.1 MAG: GxxExxY protein [Bacteroidetes bacterium GWD2_33_33]HAN19050.1 GxxExxY protein [Bacteroidales bacterium]
MTKEQFKSIAKRIVNACSVAHKEMGSGLLESIYEFCLIDKLKRNNTNVRNQVSIPLNYRGVELTKDFKIDILVEEKIILELKSVDIILPVHKAQIISYLKLADKRLGFLINFNVALIKDGISRFVNNY